MGPMADSQTVAATENEDLFAAVGEMHRRVDEVFVIDVLVSLVELKVAVDVTADVVDAVLREDDVLERRGDGGDDGIAVEELLSLHGEAAAEDQASGDQRQTAADFKKPGARTGEAFSIEKPA